MEGFSTRLRELRKERNLRQKDLAAVLGLAQTTVANYEQNTRFPDEKTLKKIVDYFNTSLDFLLGRSEQPGASSPQRTETETAPQLDLGPLARDYLDSLLAGDRAKALRLVLDECERGRTMQKIYTEVFQPALEQVGYRWEMAQADVYEEHFVSSVTVNLMAQVMRYAPPCRPHKGTVLSVVSSGEQHEIGMRMVNDFLETAGWEAVFLGTNLPVGNVMKAVEDRNADILGVSVTMQYNLNAASNLISSIRSSRSFRNLRVMVGGQAFRSDTGLWRRIGADAVALSADEAVTEADRLIANHPRIDR